MYQIDVGRVTRTTHKNSNDAVISSFAYTYDNVGNRRTVTEDNGDVVTWTYDNANQLTREQRGGDDSYDMNYTYDSVGNRSTKVDSSGTTTYTYDAANELTAATDPGSDITTYSYDNNGNLTTQNAAGSVTTHDWDYDNRLHTVTLPSTAIATFAYDGDGLRREKQTSAATAKFIWDGQDVLLETDGEGRTQVTYTQTPDLYGALVSQRRGDATSFYHFDALGSTTELTDVDEAETDSYRYYAFGETLTSSGATANNFRFVGNLGYYNEAALSLQYLRARYYQPSTGRFISPDSARPEPEYLYASNMPVNRTDPSGLAICTKESSRSTFDQFYGTETTTENWEIGFGSLVGSVGIPMLHCSANKVHEKWKIGKMKTVLAIKYECECPPPECQWSWTCQAERGVQKRLEYYIVATAQFTVVYASDTPGPLPPAFDSRGSLADRISTCGTVMALYQPGMPGEHSRYAADRRSIPDMSDCMRESEEFPKRKVKPTECRL